MCGFSNLMFIGMNKLYPQQTIKTQGQMLITNYRDIFPNLRARIRLQSSNLRSSNLRSSNLRSFNLRSFNLRSSNLPGLNLRSLNLQIFNLQIFSRDYYYFNDLILTN